MHTGQMQPEKLPGAKTEAVPQGLLCTGKEAQVFPEVIEVAIRIAEHSKVFHAGSCRSLIQEWFLSSFVPVLCTSNKITGR